MAREVTMDENANTIDPYHRWLGIPANEQPANHYRLLGLSLFESDPEVIRDGAERQMTHVRKYQLGKHFRPVAGDSQRDRRSKGLPVGFEEKGGVRC